MSVNYAHRSIMDEAQEMTRLGRELARLVDSVARRERRVQRCEEALADVTNCLTGIVSTICRQSSEVVSADVPRACCHPVPLDELRAALDMLHSIEALLTTDVSDMESQPPHDSNNSTNGNSSDGAASSSSCSSASGESDGRSGANEGYAASRGPLGNAADDATVSSRDPAVPWLEAVTCIVPRTPPCADSHTSPSGARRATQLPPSPTPSQQCYSSSPGKYSEQGSYASRRYSPRATDPSHKYYEGVLSVSAQSGIEELSDSEDFNHAGPCRTGWSTVSSPQKCSGRSFVSPRSEAPGTNQRSPQHRPPPSDWLHDQAQMGLHDMGNSFNSPQRSPRCGSDGIADDESSDT